MPKSPRSAPNAVRVIDVLTYPAAQLLDVTGPIQVFASANDLLTGTGGARPYVLRVVAQIAFGPNLHPRGAAVYDAKAREKSWHGTCFRHSAATSSAATSFAATIASPRCAAENCLAGRFFHQI
jgi:hypothetical protein